MLQLLSFGKKKIKNTLNIYVKSSNTTLSVDLSPQMEIKDLKEMVAPKLGLSVNEMKIIFAGKELMDSTVISECDLGQQSVLHAVKSRARPEISKANKRCLESALEEAISEEPSKPLSSTLVDLQLNEEERRNISEENRERSKATFWVHCSDCKRLCKGKLRVRCSICKGGAFEIFRDPVDWNDVLEPHRIHGYCETQEVACVQNADNEPPYAEFYFKCAEHPSQGEKDYAAPLSLIKTNLKNIPCLSCGDIADLVLVFPCAAGHVTCIECFKLFCTSRLSERQFIHHPDIGYTLACPVGCEDSFIMEVHHFKVLTKEQYDRYQRFATEEFVLQSGGVLCPQVNCGMGILVDEDCNRVQCLNGCGYVFCKSCLQGYHIGECLPELNNSNLSGNCEYSVDPERAVQARWDEASRITIKVITKPCPKCRTPTERDGGCMHMVCTKCNFDWCWVCQIEWNRDCMGQHWFG